MYFRIFILLLLASYMYADGFLEEDKESYQKSKTDSNILVFVTSYVIPVSTDMLQDTPYGKMLEISQELLSPKHESQIVSKGIYNNGNYTIFRSDNNAITFYRHSRNKTNQYSTMAPNVYKVEHFAGNFYKVEPMPNNLFKCSLIISRTFEKQKENTQLLINLDSIPNRGVANILLECPK